MGYSSARKHSLSTPGLSIIDLHYHLSHFKANWNQSAYVSKYLHILPTSGCSQMVKTFNIKPG